MSGIAACPDGAPCCGAPCCGAVGFALVTGIARCKVAAVFYVSSPSRFSSRYGEAQSVGCIGSKAYAKHYSIVQQFKPALKGRLLLWYSRTVRESFARPGCIGCRYCLRQCGLQRACINLGNGDGYGKALYTLGLCSSCRCQE